MYIATFHTHFGAMSFHRMLQKRGDKEACMMPVPRALSAACGTCVRFSLPFAPDMAAEDLDSVVRETGGSFETVFVKEE